MSHTWTGSWAADHLGIRLTTRSSSTGQQIEDLVGVAVRRNPMRAQLLVSSVLGKHVPTDPKVVQRAGLALGELVKDRGVSDPLVLGFAETATSLGHLVADALRAPYLHSTRRRASDAPTWAAFSEDHSHATDHLLQPWPVTFFESRGTLILVDDEISTARTALHTIEAIHQRAPRSHYVVASLMDMRDAALEEQCQQFADDLSITIEFVSLVRGSVTLPEAVTIPDYPTSGIQLGALGAVTFLDAPWPPHVREGGRHSFSVDGTDFATAVSATAQAVAALGVSGRVHVLGTEELMYTPLRIASELAGIVTFSTTTRSPAVVLDAPGYAIRTGISFDAHEHGAEGRRYAYNLEPGAYDAIVLVVDERSPVDVSTELVQILRRLSPHLVVVTLPAFVPPAPLRGPTFGSYESSDVAWLLTDLSDVSLEAPAEEREEAMQGGGHYAESLPIEYQPDADYHALFHDALAMSTERVAQAVAVVGEQIRAVRGDHVVLASLARAGTPVGILLRRWAQDVHCLEWPHYAVSIVRDRGIDLNALAWLALQHDPPEVIFVDGWTGKGAITRELEAAITSANKQLGTDFRSDLAVLADPGQCASVYGTRDDFLVPSACLNSTVSGLVSRTVLNASLLRSDQFHGAKFYAELAEADVSRYFIETVAGHFPKPQPNAGGIPTPQDHLEPTWAGRAAVEYIGKQLGIENLNLIKPGVGETTRVLLRRVPWQIWFRPDRESDLQHIRLLAQRRGVPMVPAPDLPFSCVGIIKPVSRGRGA